MDKQTKHSGFSLTEVLLATGILAIGFVMIAMVFPVGIKLTSVATERTIGPVAAQEAEAKLNLYGIDEATLPNTPVTSPDQNMRLFCRHVYTINSIQIFQNAGIFPADLNWLLRTESFYPSLDELYFDFDNDTIPDDSHKYRWWALCRRTDPGQGQAVIFVCRRIGEGMQYFGIDPVNFDSAPHNPRMGLTVTPADPYYPDWPMPVPVQMTILTITPNRLQLQNPQPTAGSLYPYFPVQDSYRFFTEDCRIVDDTNGQIHRILDRQDADNDGFAETLVIQPSLVFPPATPSPALKTFWVVPPAYNSSRDPCINVYTFPIQLN